MWFEQLMGFREESPRQVRSNITLKGVEMTSCVNGRRLSCGELETPTLAELRKRVIESKPIPGSMVVREVVEDVQQLHSDVRNAGAVFQVASQFNLLEMVSPDITPEQGVGRYERDRTQGPACAIAAGAGTIYRNYFVPVRGQTGQSVDNQIDCLEDIGEFLDNEHGRLWQMRNGYALATEAGLVEITDRLVKSSESGRDQIRERLRIGIQWDTQVTLHNASHKVSQVYCSALPVAYSRQPATQWAHFASLILESAYEATFCAAILNTSKTGNNIMFLTLLGGGAFGNQASWIMQAIERAVNRYSKYGLDVVIVSYGSSKPAVQKLITRLKL